MPRADLVRYQLFLPRALSTRFEQLAAAPGASKSAILAAALTHFLERRSASDHEERFGRRLDRLAGQLDRIERDGHIQVESLALFIRYMLSVHAPLAEEDAAARAVGRDRFAAFVARVSQQLAAGRRTLGGDQP